MDAICLGGIAPAKWCAGFSRGARVVSAHSDYHSSAKTTLARATLSQARVTAVANRGAADSCHLAHQFALIGWRCEQSRGDGVAGLGHAADPHRRWFCNGDGEN